MRMAQLQSGRVFGVPSPTLGTLLAAWLLLPPPPAHAQSATHSDPSNRNGETRIDYARQIAPLFARHCFRCHGPERHESGLRLDHRPALLLGVDSGPAIVPGQAQQSQLWRRVAATEPGERMPPDGDPLTARDIALLRAWIDQGAHCNAMFDAGVRWESVLDQVNTTAAVWLGLTAGCAQCHSHKTDPLTQRDYYRLYAFFNDAGMIPITLDGQPVTPPPPAARRVAAAEMDSAETARPTTLVLQAAVQPTQVFVRGDPKLPGETVEPGFPEFLLPSIRSPASPSGHTSSLPLASSSDRLTRLDLARWLVHSEHSLTARVTANRQWQRFFGSGLVETEDDFGRQTAAPPHQELLDYLAAELQAGLPPRPPRPSRDAPPWSGLKRLHRLIVTSATYRQSLVARGDLSATDPENRFYARQRRWRVEAEILRDLPLAVSGILTLKVGGPSVFPEQPEGILENRATPASWTTNSGEDAYRRGMYTWIWRLTPHPHLPLFDGPDGVTACTRRDRSNVPVQALTTLNDPWLIACARALAKRIHLENLATDDNARLAALYGSCLSRQPDPDESRIVLELLEQQRRSLAADPAAAALIGTAGSVR
jgi:mono/diheme cytochrome c family protein